jgi:hypothetical protein
VICDFGLHIIGSRKKHHLKTMMCPHYLYWHDEITRGQLAITFVVVTSNKISSFMKENFS